MFVLCYKDRAGYSEIGTSLIAKEQDSASNLFTTIKSCGAEANRKSSEKLLGGMIGTSQATCV